MIIDDMWKVFVSMINQQIILIWPFLATQKQQFLFKNFWKHCSIVAEYQWIYYIQELFL